MARLNGKRMLMQRKSRNGRRKTKKVPSVKEDVTRPKPEEKHEEEAINSEEPVANQSDQAQTEQVDEQTVKTDEIDEKTDGATFVDAGSIALPKHAVARTSPRRGSKRWKLRMLKSHDNLTGCCPRHGKRMVEENTQVQQQQQQQHVHAESPGKKKHGSRTKKNKGTKDIQVSAVKKPPTKPKSTKGSKQPKGEPVKEAVDLIMGLLKACEENECTHPDWEAFQYDSKVYSLSIYWSRRAVGVKVAKHIVDKLKGKNAKNGKSKVKGQDKSKGKGKWTQIAYFACPTECYYSNVVLAYEYAPRNDWTSNFDGGILLHIFFLKIVCI